MLIDYHIHNHFSPDSDSPTEAIAKKAIKKGLGAICITNHSETFTDGEGEPGSVVLKNDLKRFRLTKSEIEVISAKYPNLMIGFGGEVQYEEGNMDQVTGLVENTPFDFILGSVHNLDDINISGHKHAHEFYEKRSEKEAYGGYFENLLKLIEWGQIDAVAHFDICKKFGHEIYGPFEPRNHREILIRILMAMKQKGIGLELNTGSLHKRCEELFPHPDILKWAVEIGIEHYTLGSDAHDVNHIAQYFDEALKIAKDVGIKTISTYEKRNPTKHKI